MRTFLLALLLAIPSCDGGKNTPEAPEARPARRWRFVGGAIPVEVATEDECKALLFREKDRAAEEKHERLAALTESAAKARATEEHACAEAKILCDISTPAKKEQCDETRQRLEATCREASHARTEADQRLAAPAPAVATLTCEPIAAKP